MKLQEGETAVAGGCHPISDDGVVIGERDGRVADDRAAGVADSAGKSTDIYILFPLRQ